MGGIGRLPIAAAGVGLSVGMRVLLLLDMMVVNYWMKWASRNAT